MYTSPCSDIHSSYPIRYQFTDILGHGSYGVVHSALATDYRGNQGFVAIKAIRPFCRTSKCVRTLREIRILRHFQHENITRLLDVRILGDAHSFSTVYLVQELMDSDLSIAIKERILQRSHIQYILYQILRGVIAIHSAGVIHREIGTTCSL